MADGPWEIPHGVQRYSFQELTKATNNWSESNAIGEGGFGKVFHGVFDDGKMVAIKRGTQNSDVSKQGALEFRNEVLLLSRLHHRHLVRLEGFCDDRGLQAHNSLTFFYVKFRFMTFAWIWNMQSRSESKQSRFKFSKRSIRCSSCILANNLYLS